MKGPGAKERILGGLWGAVTGDALGVPVEFKDRATLKKGPVTDMRANGTHRQPKGTWSDDSSLLICTVESLLEGFDTDRMGQLFLRWLTDCYWTPWGKVFDIGGTTRDSLMRIRNGMTPELAGGASDYDNGNGSLMRILPVGLRFADAPSSEMFEHAHRASSITHRHPRSQMACGFYCLMAAALLKSSSSKEAYYHAIEEAHNFYHRSSFSSEVHHFERILSGRISEVPEQEIQSGGYVIHTLEASIWCLLTSGSFAECVLKAVNLGGDTDTTACVAGGLAGIYYGLETIPVEWIHIIPREKEINRLFLQFCGVPG